MEQFLYHIGNFAILFLIAFIIIFAIIIYFIWYLLKTAIAKGVEDGIYNAVISLKKDGVISDTIYEINEISKSNNIQLKENPTNETNNQTSYYNVNK